MANLDLITLNNVGVKTRAPSTDQEVDFVSVRIGGHQIPIQEGTGPKAGMFDFGGTIHLLGLPDPTIPNEIARRQFVTNQALQSTAQKQWQHSIIAISNDSPDHLTLNEGDRYLVGPSPTPSGEFDGFANYVAQWDGSTWNFIALTVGAFVVSDSVVGTFDQWNGSSYDLHRLEIITTSLGVQRVGEDIRVKLSANSGLELNAGALRVKVSPIDTIIRDSNGLSARYIETLINNDASTLPDFSVVRFDPTLADSVALADARDATVGPNTKLAITLPGQSLANGTSGLFYVNPGAKIDVSGSLSLSIGDPVYLYAGVPGGITTSYDSVFATGDAVIQLGTVIETNVLLFDPKFLYYF